MSDLGDINNQDSDFYLDPSLFNLDIVKRIGIEKSSNSLIVKASNQIITQTINIEAFSDRTIRPLKIQLSEILLGYKNKEDMQKLINSVVTCINSNIAKISKHCKENSSILTNDSGDENSKVDGLINLALKPENTEKLFKDQYERAYAAVRLGDVGILEILAIDSIKYKRYLSKLCRENTGSSISDNSVNTAITNLAAEAEFNGCTIPLHLRTALGSDENGTKKIVCIMICVMLKGGLSRYPKITGE